MSYLPGITLLIEISLTSIRITVAEALRSDSLRP